MADVLTGGPDGPRRRWIATGLVVAVAAVVVLLRRDASPPVAPPAAAPTTTFEIPSASPAAPTTPPAPCPSPAAGVALARIAPGSTVELCDRTAADGPSTVLVRRADGSLGRHGAVVTYPVDVSTAPRTVAVGRVTGRIGAGALTWPVTGGAARVRGDLSEAELVAVAEGVTIVDGRLGLRPPRGFAVVWTGPYRPPVVGEIRYGSTALGEAAALGDGLTYTGMATGGGVEDQLYARHARAAGSVRGRPALLSSVFGGNATLAWETAPGVVAFVGYSGSGQSGRTTAALLRLAARSRVLTHARWQATHPLVVDQVNDPS